MAGRPSLRFKIIAIAIATDFIIFSKKAWGEGFQIHKKSQFRQNVG